MLRMPGLLLWHAVGLHDRHELALHDGSLRPVPRRGSGAMGEVVMESP
ncbi:hypothetical protein [Brachybacterium sp. SGAir0954]|nr:hypothetical protein [Brachybacterium sp. SGAir0954]